MVVHSNKDAYIHAHTAHLQIIITAASWPIYMLLVCVCFYVSCAYPLPLLFNIRPIVPFTVIQGKERLLS